MLTNPNTLFSYALLVLCMLLMAGKSTTQFHSDESYVFFAKCSSFGHLCKRASGESSSQSDPAKKQSTAYLAKSVKQLERIKDHGLSLKGFSNIGVIGEERMKNRLPKIEVKNGKRSGQVISWILQHPDETTVGHQPERQKGKDNKQSIPTYANSVHVSGFVETGYRSPEEHNVLRRLSKLVQDGHHVVHMSSSSTQPDRSSSSKYPFLHVKSGNQHSRVLSAFLDDGKDAKFKSSRHSQALGTSHSSQVQTIELIDKLDKRPRSLSVRSSSDSGSRGGLQGNKRSRKL